MRLLEIGPAAKPVVAPKDNSARPDPGALTGYRQIGDARTEKDRAPHTIEC